MIVCHLTPEPLTARSWRVHAVAIGDAGVVAERTYDVAAASTVPGPRLPAYIDRMLDDAGDNLRLELGTREQDWKNVRTPPPMHIDADALDAMIDAEIAETTFVGFVDAPDWDRQANLDVKARG